MKKNNVTDIKLDEVSLVDKGANPGAHFVLMKRQILKKEKNESFPVDAYAYTPDIGNSDSWKLRLWDSISKKETVQHISKLIVAVSKGLRLNQIRISKSNLTDVKKKILLSWYNTNTVEKRKETVEILDMIKKGYGKTFDELMYENEVIWMLWDAISVLEESFYTIMYDEDITDKKLKIDETTSQFQQSINKIGGTVDMAEQDVLQKSFDELKVKYDTIAKDHTDLITKSEKLEEDLAKACADDKAKKDDKNIKKEDMTEDVRKKFEDLEKHDKDQAELIAKLLDEKEDVVYLEKAKGFEHLPMKTNELGILLKSVGNAVSKEDMENLLSLFSAIDKAISKGELFKEIGAGGSSTNGDAFSKMLGKADELKKASSDLTKEQAFVKVMEDDPELYNQYLEEQRA